jgi:hypothetical protein
MIDWYFVFTHSLWILGLSIALAACSYHDWLRKVLSRPLRQQLREPSFRFPLNIGFLLVAVAFTLLESSRWWARALWFLLACSFGWSAWTTGRPVTTRNDRHQ